MSFKQIVNRVSDPKVAGQLRHLMTTFGGVLASKGVIDEVSWQLYVGLGFACLGFIASWNATEKKS